MKSARKFPPSSFPRRHASRSVAGALLLASLTVSSGPGCRKSETAIDAASQPVKLVISGDTDGWITPCGCTSNQSGGLLRRGTYINDLRQHAQLVYADVGGAVRGNSDYDRLKLKAILSGEELMGVAAHNIGGAEAAFGPQALRALIHDGAPLISANVRDPGGQLIAGAVKVITVGGRRIAITGVCSPRFASDQVRIDDPRQAVLAATSGAKGTYDSLIVLAYLPQDELEQLAASLPEADAIVGGPTGQPVPPRQVGPTLLTSATNKGKFLAVLSLSHSRRWGGSIVELNGAYPDQGVQVANLKRFLGELRSRDFTAAQSGLAPPLPPQMPADYRIAGSESCSKCHQAEFAVWQHMDHSHAWQTLVSKGFEVDPECMQCHTTGFGLPGGFKSRGRTPERVEVGCESCHGPSAAHVADPTRRTPFRAADQCTQCHDRENSPKFEYASYWSRIQHGPSTRPSREAEHAAMQP